jgi:hypothetical protein
MIIFKHSGNFKNTDKFLTKMSTAYYINIFDKYGREGVAALASVTPKDSGDTANSWGYKIRRTRSGISIIWTNSHIVNGIPIAVILQYGHATRNGGYVQGRDYINPAIHPIFDRIMTDLWREVTTV